MSHDPSCARSPFIDQIDVGQPVFHPAKPAAARPHDVELGALLRLLVAGQERQNELLEELVSQVGANQRQRAAELGNWKQANPHLARRCRKAVEALGKVHAAFLDSMTREINDNYENLMEGDFLLNEFIDRFGPRMVHLNGLLQVLSQLSATPNPATAPNST